MNKRRYQKLVAIYLLASLIWIIGSDWLLAQFIGDFNDSYVLSAGKGVAFVTLMSGLLYVLLMRLNSAERQVASAVTDSTEQLVLNKIPTFFQHIPMLTYAVNWDGKTLRTLWVSDNLYDLLGYTQEEALQPGWWEKCVHPDDRLRALEESKTILANGGGDHYYRVKHAKGHYVYFHDELRRVESVSATCFVGIWRDISTEESALEQVQEYSTKLEKTILGTITAISHMVELRDPYTAGHESRVGELASAIALEMGLDMDTQYGLRIAGLLHDIGKISIPAEYLTKPTRLTDAEFEIIKSHACNGYNILKNIAFPWPVAEVAYQHHERLDGTGYPRGLKGDEILLEARIITVADVIESMATNRPYRHALGIKKALQEIEQHAGKLYDPEVCNAALTLFRQKNYKLGD